MSVNLMVSATFVVIVILGDLTGACLKREEPKPQIAKNAVVDSDKNSTIQNFIVMTNCTPENKLYYDCRNGGHCVVETNIENNLTRTECACPEKFAGKFCERKYRMLPQKNASVYAAAGASAVVLLILVIGVIAVIKIRNNRRTQGERGRPDSPCSPSDAGNNRPSFSLYSSGQAQKGDGAARPENVELLDIHRRNGNDQRVAA